MNWSLFTNEWRLKVLALALAVLMLGAVAFAQNPPTTRPITVPLNYVVPPNIILVNPPTKTTVVISGLAGDIQRVDNTNLIATADATRALPGSAVRLNIVAHSLLGSAVSVQNPVPIAVQVDTRQVVALPVQVIARPAPGWSVTKTQAICPGSQAPSPCKIHFDGPVSWETNMVASATLPGNVQFSSIDSPNQPVSLRNSNGPLDLSSCRTQPCSTVDANSVNLHIEAAAGASSSTVPIVDVAPSHGPPAGYRVTAVSITPVTVIISGDPAILARIPRLVLDPVDLSSSTSDATFQVAIKYPDGVTGVVANATIKYSISRNPNVSPSP